MPIIYVLAGFLGGYLLAMVRQNLQERDRRHNSIRRMRSQGWTDLRTTGYASVGLLILLLLIWLHH